MIGLGQLLWGAAFAQPVELADHQPLPGYLSAEQVEPVLTEVLPSLVSCLQGQTDSPTAIAIMLDVTRLGEVAGVRASLDPPAVEPHHCVRQALCGLAFPPHDETYQRWAFDIAHRSEQAFLLPSLTLVPRPRLPLFLYLPVPADADHLAWLERVLGSQLYPLPTQAELPSCLGFPSDGASPPPGLEVQP